MRAPILLAALAGLAYAQPPVGSRPLRVDELHTPPGFEVSVYARVSGGPRQMAFGPNGVLYVAARGGGSIVAVPETDRTVTVLRGLSGPHSVVFRGNDLYVAVNDGVLRYPDAITADLMVRSTAERLLRLPTGGQHTTRTAFIGPDDRLYITAGSTCNFCVEADQHRAAMMRYELDGSGETIFARGLRNSVGFAWHPLTAELWALDNGGDGLGEDSPPEEINIVQAGGDYGWPDCIAQKRGINWGTGARPQRCADTLGPEQEMQGHSAPLGISFYSGSQFPAQYTNDAFVGFHGSWNRNTPTGYKVVRVRASSGRAQGVEDFLWGFLDLNSRTASGRPVHPLAGPDGALYVSDDMTGNIYRVIYTGPRIAPGGIVPRDAGVYELYGSNLVNDPAALTVSANGIACQLLYTSAGQINFLLPDGITGQITITVQNEKASDSAVIPQ